MMCFSSAYVLLIAAILRSWRVDIQSGQTALTHSTEPSYSCQGRLWQLMAAVALSVVEETAPEYQQNRG